MDRDGVEFSVMFPPIVSLQVSDPELQAAIIQGYNDWAAEFASSAPNRFTAVALLSPDNPQYAANELQRIAKEGRLKQVGFLVNDVTTGIYLEDWGRSGMRLKNRALSPPTMSEGASKRTR
jgi:predicted TIM-barrel fold metal-dependent hydrolase